jgi:hypothetical protein
MKVRNLQLHTMACNKRKAALHTCSRPAVLEAMMTSGMISEWKPLLRLLFAGPAMHQKLLPRLERVPLCAPWGEGQAQGPSNLQVHWHWLPRHEEGDVSGHLLKADDKHGLLQSVVQVKATLAKDCSALS